jgi:UDP-2-acetamido-3-amino-2,3-dideoxy-glucuronate N-acetyltransferase
MNGETINKYFRHETSIIDENVVIGEGTKVWAFSHISRDVVIGHNCTIGEGVYIGPGVTIGNNCKIQNHCLIYEGVTVEDNVFIGPNVVTTNDIMPRAVGKWEDRYRTTLLKTGCSVGANSTLLCGITLNEHCMIACGSVVVTDIDKWSLAIGNPAKHHKYLST